MKSVTIPQASHKSNIYDLANQNYDRVIWFRGKTQYAVVLPAYYNARYWTTSSYDSAIRIARRLQNKGYQCVRVIDTQGDCYEVNSIPNGGGYGLWYVEHFDQD